MTNTFHPCRLTPTQNTRTCIAAPHYLQDIITAHQTVKNNVVARRDNEWLSEVMTGAETLPWTSCPGAHTHAFCLRLNDEQGPTQGPCQTTDSRGAEHRAASSQLSPASHITALCGKPRFHHTLHHPADHSSIWSYGEGGASLRHKMCLLTWKAEAGASEITVERKNTLLDGWMTAERVAGQQQGKPCGLLNCIPLRLRQCDDAHDDEDNK